MKECPLTIYFIVITSQIVIMITTRGDKDKENESDEHLSNKRNRVSKFTSLKETDLAGVCEDESEDEKPTTQKKQKVTLNDDDDDDVPEKSRKKKKKKKKQRGATKKKNGWRSNSTYNYMKQFLLFFLILC